MGQAFVVAVIPEELLGADALFDVDEHGRESCIRDLYGEAEWNRLNEEAVRDRYPEAHYRMPAKYLRVWQPPAEPYQEHGLDWHKRPELRRDHRDAVRRSLQELINGQLAKLYHRLRTGWWVLGKVRVRVAECREVPEREMRARARAFG